MNHRGILVLISSPSGGGKNSVIRKLIDHIDDAVQFVTTTTRDRREGEINGTDYHFISRNVFEKKIEAGDFVEYNDYAGNLYGTEKEKLDAITAALQTTKNLQTLKSMLPECTEEEIRVVRAWKNGNGK